MRLSFSGLTRRLRTVKSRTTPRETFFRPALEVLEGRLVLSAPAALGPPVLAPALTPAAAPTGQQLVTQALNLQINNVTAQNGQLLANGTVGGIPFTAPLTLTPTPNAADPTCPILNLHLNAIHLNLLGLNVDTSNICLAINADSTGGVLGSLLCNIASSLNSTGSNLGSILGGLTSTQLTSLTSTLTTLLNGVTGQLAAAPPANPTNPPGTCDVLDLSVGPVNLNVLGLDVTLDNCSGGPVTVDVYAQPGPGNLLGNLLCNLSNLLNNPNATNAVAALLNNVLRDINRIYGLL